MKPSVQKIITKLAKEKINLFTVSEAKSILKYEIYEKVNEHRSVLGNNVEDLKSLGKKDAQEIDSLKQKQEKELDDLLKKQEQKVNSIISTLDNEIKQSKNLIKEIEKNISKFNPIVKEFEKELIDMGIKPSASNLYQEVKASVSLLETDKNRLQQGIDFVENNYEYKTRK